MGSNSGTPIITEAGNFEGENVLTARKPLAEVADAWTRQAAGRAAGRIVLTMPRR